MEAIKVPECDIVLMGYTCSGKQVFANKFLKRHVKIDMRDISPEIFRGNKNKTYSWRIIKYISEAVNGIAPIAVIVANNSRAHRLKILEKLKRPAELYYIKRDPIACLEENGGNTEVLHEPLKSEGFSRITIIENESYKFKRISRKEI